MPFVCLNVGPFSRLGLASAGGFGFVVDGASPKNAVRLSVRRIASTSRGVWLTALCGAVMSAYPSYLAAPILKIFVPHIGQVP